VTDRVDIHDRKNTFESAVNSLEDTELSEDNIRAVKRFIQAHKSQDRSYDRMQNYIYSFKRIDQEIDFKLEDATQEQVTRLVGYVNKELSEEYAPATVNETRKTINNFYTFYLDRPELVKNVSTTVSKSKEKDLKPENILRPREVKHIIRKATTQRDKALIMTTWATGGRIEETLSLKWSDITLDGVRTAAQFPQSKTETRRVNVAEAFPYLKQYAQQANHSPEELVFQARSGNHKQNREYQGGAMTYQAAAQVFRNAAQNTDLPEMRETTPHKYRKSRATYFAAIGQSAQFLMDFFGWSSYEQAEKYVNLVQEDMEQSYYDAIGLDVDAEGGFNVDEENLKPRSCHVCGSIVSPAMSTCWSCQETINPDDLLSALEPEETNDGGALGSVAENVGITEDELKDVMKDILDE
jgi:site-specific recombinase XerD